MPTPTPRTLNVGAQLDDPTLKRREYAFLPDALEASDDKTSLDLERRTLEVVVVNTTPHTSPSPSSGWQNDRRLSRPDNCVPVILSALFRAMVDSFMG
jgi:hypothetical protein